MQLVPTDHRAGDAGDTRASRLRTLIARKRTEKQRLERDIQDSRGQLAELDALRQRRLGPIDDEVHGHFGFVLKSRRFSADARRQLRQLYLELMRAETISPRDPPGARKAPPDQAETGPCQCPYCTGERDADGELPPWAEEDAGSDGEARVHMPPRRQEPSASLRGLYRELASRYHPDKAGDEDTRAEHERLMREINGAYDAGDLDALAALSQELGFDIAGDGVLEVLAAQYERIKAQVRDLRRDLLGQLVVETRRCKKRGEATPLAAMTAHIDRHAELLEDLADLFRAYRAGSLSREAFLDELLGADEPDSELDIDQLLAAMASMTPRKR